MIIDFFQLQVKLNVTLYLISFGISNIISHNYYTIFVFCINEKVYQIELTVTTIYLSNRNQFNLFTAYNLSAKQIIFLHVHTNL